MVCSHAPIVLYTTKSLVLETKSTLLPALGNHIPQTVPPNPPPVYHARHAPIYGFAATAALTARLNPRSHASPVVVTALDSPQGRPDATDNGDAADPPNA